MQTNWNRVITKEFWSDFAGLPSDVTQRAKRAIDRMLQDPWAPELHPEPVKSAEKGVHSCRADDNYRIIWKYVKPNDIFFLLIDKHDQAYRRAARKSFILDKDNVIHVADIVEVGAQLAGASGALFEWARKGDDKYGTLFIGYRDQELLDIGVPADILPNIRALDDTQQLEQVEQLLPEETFWKLLDIVTTTVERPVVPDNKLSESLRRFQGGDELYLFVDSEEFKRALDGSMEEWMLFLAPSQRLLALRNFNGPARVRGVAGSGKTVVALHRARYLARESLGTNKKVLFLTYGNRLPGVVTYLFEKLAGENAPELDRFESLTIHQLCGRLLHSAGVQLEIDKKILPEILARSVERTKQRYNLVKLFSRSIQFFQDEISYSIKGRAINSLEEYLNLSRTGRGSALQPSEREAMFAVYQDYQSQLRMAGKHDFDDIILCTLQLLEAGEFESEYAHIVVDEIQDLTEATMRLIRLLSNPAPNDLFLVGDGTQRIFPGGYSLNKLSIDVVGRSTLLRKNYRNTQQILRTAYAVVSDIRLDDMEETDGDIPEPEYSVRQGEVPELKGFTSPENEIHWVSQEINRLVGDGYRQGDIALVYRWSYPYKKLIEDILASQMPALEVSQGFETIFGPSLKYTTFHSAKGLEFKVVFVLGVTDGQFVPRDDWTLEGEELTDYLEREKRLLYVAMTRARDLLYLTYSRGQPSRFLANVPRDYIRQ
jgi:superfamily I DNA/RNA helicase/mRNA-degrading endonuclease RelE of RelBE toxin-antitoxin system